MFLFYQISACVFLIHMFLYVGFYCNVQEISWEIYNVYHDVVK